MSPTKTLWYSELMTHRGPFTAAPSSAPAVRPQPAEPFDWQRAHRELSRLALLRAGLDAEEGRWLLCARRSAAHLKLGFGSFVEYIQRLFGYKPRTTEEKLRVAEALEQLPELEQALRDGVLSWSAVRELTRVATPQNETEWIARASGCPLREIEQLVTGRRPGDGPADPQASGQERRVLRFEVRAETLALFREALAKLGRDTPGSLDDDTALWLMARQVLGGPADAGRASYQVALTVCQQCERGWLQGKGELIEVGPEIVQMAGCDAQHIGFVHERTTLDAPVGGGAVAQSPPLASPVRPAAAPVGGGIAQEPSPAAPNAVAGRPQPAMANPRRARQKIPPAVRRWVLRRDGGRCRVTGCQSSLFIDLHHLDPRAEGGTSDPDRLICLCGAHHRAVHRGHLIVQGRVSTGLRFYHADGTNHGGKVSTALIETQTRVFRMLRGLGFRETLTRRALERVRDDAKVDLGDAEQVLRAALAVLTETPRAA